MLQGEIHRFPTVACFRADVLIFLSFKNLTEHLAHQWIVIGDQYGPSHAAFAASRVTLALSFFLAQRIRWQPYRERSKRAAGLSRKCRPYTW
jgi:hypothetical protein